MKPTDMIVGVRYIVTRGSSSFRKGDSISWVPPYILNHTVGGFMEEVDAILALKRVKVDMDRAYIERQIAYHQNMLDMLRGSLENATE